jgi:hypothetical protein
MNEINKRILTSLVMLCILIVSLHFKQVIPLLIIIQTKAFQASIKKRIENKERERERFIII